MIPFVAVRARRGKLVHAVSQGADSPRVTFCSRDANGWTVPETGEVTCATCAEWISGRTN